MYGIEKGRKFNIVVNVELSDIDKEECSQNIQKKKACYYKKDGNTAAYGYTNKLPRNNNMQ